MRWAVWSMNESFFLHRSGYPFKIVIIIEPVQNVLHWILVRFHCHKSVWKVFAYCPQRLFLTNISCTPHAYSVIFTSSFFHGCIDIRCRQTTIAASSVENFYHNEHLLYIWHYDHYSCYEKVTHAYALLLYDS